MGVLCIKTLYSEVPDKKTQHSLLKKGKQILSIIDQINDHISFISSVSSIIDSNLHLSISLPDTSKELVIKYSTDMSLLGMVSPNQDQETYDIGNMLYKTEKIINNDLYIVTLTIPLCV
jgi:hypothetical protein